jgi:hypothetical protein
MSLNNICNIQDVNANQTSIAKVLFIFYVLIASNYTDNLMAKQMKQYINDNKTVQHIIGFFTMVILVTLVGGVVDTRSAIVYALIGYTWFVFSTKLDIHWNIMILVLLFIGYMYENSMGVREKEIVSDPNLTEEQKKETIQQYNDYKTWIVVGVVGVTIIGTLFYSHKKYEQYGAGYDIFAYVLK